MDYDNSSIEEPVLSQDATWNHVAAPKNLTLWKCKGVARNFVGDYKNGHLQNFSSWNFVGDYFCS